MLISCPKCNSVYNIVADKITNSGKKFKCAECGQIWTVYPDDVKNLEPEDAQIKPQIAVQTTENAQPQEPSVPLDNTDIEEMFNRLSKDTKGLFNAEVEKDEGSKWEKWRRKFHVFMTPGTVIGFLFILFCILTLTVCYTHRYAIVAHFPQLEGLYKEIGAESVYAGKDIKIEDVHIRHLESDGKHYVEVSGSLFNRGKYNAKLLPISAVLTNAAGDVICEALHDMPQNNLEPNFSAMFRIVLDNPTPEIKQLTLKLINRKGD
ncbi:MAG: zinc-ribbon domain-containing protein [Alphaproteobacteria bacterium]|nr:zinc-ribbon domain-containing protein [Alphaproteobacteria bacterium]